MPQATAAPPSMTIVMKRTHRLRHMPATRIRTPLLNGDNPVRPHVERQFLPEPFDERLSVLVQEPHERDRPLLRVPVGESQRARALELATQRVVLFLRGLNRLALKVLEVLLHLAQCIPRRAFE